MHGIRPYKKMAYKIPHLRWWWHICLYIWHLEHSMWLLWFCNITSMQYRIYHFLSPSSSCKEQQTPMYPWTSKLARLFRKVYTLLNNSRNISQNTKHCPKYPGENFLNKLRSPKVSCFPHGTKTGWSTAPFTKKMFMIQFWFPHSIFSKMVT